jgi:hypothetical protein
MNDLEELLIRCLCLFEFMCRVTSWKRRGARDRVSRLRSSSSTEIDLAESYAKIAADINYEKLTVFTINVHGSPAGLQPVVLEELYFIGREAITNACWGFNSPPTIILR